MIDIEILPFAIFSIRSGTCLAGWEHTPLLAMIFTSTLIHGFVLDILNISMGGQALNGLLPLTKSTGTATRHNFNATTPLLPRVGPGGHYGVTYRVVIWLLTE